MTTAEPIAIILGIKLQQRLEFNDVATGAVIFGSKKFHNKWSCFLERQSLFSGLKIRCLLKIVDVPNIIFFLSFHIFDSLFTTIFVASNNKRDLKTVFLCPLRSF